MGQKVHPLGFRLTTTQKHRSVWFAEFQNYPKLIEEDNAIRACLKTRSKDAGIAKIEIKRNNNGNKIEVTVHSGRPGILVGSAGNELKNIYKELKNVVHGDVNIIVNIVEIKNPDAEAELIGDFIVEQLEKRVAFRRAVRKGIGRAQAAKVQGIKVQVAGRLNGAEMARTEWIREGRVPLQTLRADIDYAEKRANTIYGVLGIKVWLFKGEIIESI
uniref:Small ribosomal subunit protein uS3c n=1 Tax=Pseudopedinella elastica TaxID=35684 RepID=A0A516ZAI3_9STRA|nr:ribosomal protein S3 [Pseudopedinella elastica]QDR24726.1 ribosomal protein S3 [Pseudopedinella elastica]